MKTSEFLELYDKYLWEKCSRSTYYKRVMRWVDFMEALKPVNKKEWHLREKTNSKKFKDEMEWYYKYPWVKVSRQVFYQRLYRWYSKEASINIDFIKKEKKPLSYKMGYVRQPKPIQKDNSDYNEIRIKYRKEEANVIRREYEKLIDELEYKRRITDDPIEAKELQCKIDHLKKEYQNFCLSSY